MKSWSRQLHEKHHWLSLPKGLEGGVLACRDDGDQADSRTDLTGFGRLLDRKQMKKSQIANALLPRALGFFVFIGLYLSLSGTGLVSPLLSQTTAPVFAQVTPAARFVIGTAVGAAGEQVTLNISLDTMGTAAQSIQLNLAFDGATLTSATGAPGTALPAAWLLASHSPAPGELRYVALDLAGESQAFNGLVFTATFTIDAGAPPGDVTVTAALADVRDESVAALSVAVINGEVSVCQPGDANGNGALNIFDITAIELIVAGTLAETPCADANGDGNINALDITATELLVVAP